MKNWVRFGSTTFIAATLFLLSFPAIAQAPTPLNLSGYEFRLGTPCTINGEAGKCGVAFGGWTGGKGQVADGWTPFPGNRLGLWEAEVNYIGSADFTHTVELQSGSFDLFLRNHRSISGSVTGGTVQWPQNASDSSLGCGPGVAIVTVYLSISGSPHSFAGCLHDLPAGTVIPPKIWGTLE